MDNTLVKICGLYENTSKKTGKKYFVGSLSFTSKMLILKDDNAKEGEPQWGVFIQAKEPKDAGGK